MSVAPLNAVWKRTVVLSFTIVTIFITALLFYPPPLPQRIGEKIYFKDPGVLQNQSATNPLKSLEDLTFAQLLREIWKPLKTPITAKTFLASDGATIELQSEPIWKKSLGKKLLILDVESRPLDKEGGAMAQDTVWSNLGQRAAGFLDHFLYATIHGYDYKIVRAPNYKDRWGTWVKVPVTKEMLKSYDVVVTIDADATFTHMGLPMEWLMNHWGVTKKHMVALAEDPPAERNKDWNGKLLLNTGFVISIASERTQELYDAWATCPSEERFGGCAHWKKALFHEQSAFGHLIRYNYTGPNDIRVLPCAEANGFPDEELGCTGRFLRHWWTKKQETIPHLANDFMSAMLTRMLPNLQTHVIDITDKRFDGAEILRL